MSAIKHGVVTNLHTGSSDNFTIEHGLNLQYAFDAQKEWSASMSDHLLQLQAHFSDPADFKAAASEYGTEHAHWNWTTKSLNYNTPGYEWFYTRINNKVQAIALIYHPRESRIDQQNIFYIEYISVAPWNRKSRIQKKIYGGLGIELIKTAVNFSINTLSYRPGFCLHSLKQTEDFYKHIGMMEFGEDPAYYNLNYFEMDEGTSLQMV